MNFSGKSQIITVLFLFAVTFQMVNDQVFKTNCVQCHSKSVRMGKVNLEGYANAVKFADLIYNTVVNSNPSVMPPLASGKKLTEDQRNLVSDWVNGGAVE
jgi:mono/diheme cytochrome c family protein